MTPPIKLLLPTASRTGLHLSVLFRPRNWRTSCIWATPERSSSISTGLRGATSTLGGTHKGSTSTSTDSTSKSLVQRRILLAERMVRIEMLRSERNWELAITLHTLSRVPDQVRPQIVSKPLFRGRDGVLSVDLWKDQHRGLRGKLAPAFYSRAGEALPFPPPFEEAIRKITAAACCVGCKHTHVGVPPVVVNHVTNNGQLA